MKIREKIRMGRADLVKEGPITIVAFGDSVTHGAVADGEIDYESVYWARLRRKINAVSSYVPVNVINAGIGGLTAIDSVERMERQVLSHHPDLVIVCFGLNDVNRELEDYLAALREIFEKCTAVCGEVILMTPNMLNTYVDENTPKQHYEYAKKTAEMQNSGRMDRYMNASMELARQMGVTVCDCYGEWKKLSKTTDTTALLANRVNHPVRRMHELFADMLFRLILPDAAGPEKIESTMYLSEE